MGEGMKSKRLVQKVGLGGVGQPGQRRHVCVYEITESIGNLEINFSL